MPRTRITVELEPGWHEGVGLPRFIPTSVHGALDYATSGFNLVAPSVLGLKDSPAAARMPRLVGAAGTLYSLLTDYELGLVGKIPMPAHLALDGVEGALLASSPWIFGFAARGTRYWLPHVVVGTADVLASLTSKKYPS